MGRLELPTIQTLRRRVRIRAWEARWRGASSVHGAVFNVASFSHAPFEHRRQSRNNRVPLRIMQLMLLVRFAIVRTVWRMSTHESLNKASNLLNWSTGRLMWLNFYFYCRFLFLVFSILFKRSSHCELCNWCHVVRKIRDSVRCHECLRMNLWIQLRTLWICRIND